MKDNININEVDFIYQDIIEIDFENFVIYKIDNQWFAEYKDSEVYDEEILLEDVEQDLIFEGGNVFGTIISKEQFEKFRELE